MIVLVIGPSATIASFETNEYHTLTKYKKVPTTRMLEKQAEGKFIA